MNTNKQDKLVQVLEKSTDELNSFFIKEPRMNLLYSILKNIKSRIFSEEIACPLKSAWNKKKTVVIKSYNPQLY